jgi:uncharacterized protein
VARGRQTPSRAPGASRLLLAGVSVRALAASAASSRGVAELFPGGIVALDYFGDADFDDLSSRCRLQVVSLPRDLGLRRSVASLGHAALALDWSGVAYAGGFENRPGLIRLLERRGSVLGSRAISVHAVRDPDRLFPCLARAGFRHPRTSPRAAEAPAASAGLHLFKPLRSGGGSGIRPAIPGERRPPGCCLQEWIDGAAGSAAALGNGRAAVVLGVTEQIAGWEALGGARFRYGGNIAGPAEALLPRAALESLERAASLLTVRFGLTGLFGIDYILRDGEPWLLEVNPRYTASMELLEELSGRNLFDLHLAAIRTGSLPSPAPGNGPAPCFAAKGILYARRSIVAPHPDVLRRIDCRDRPQAGERIEEGSPICSIVVRGASARECRRKIEERAAAAGARLDPRETTGPVAFPAERRSW